GFAEEAITATDPVLQPGIVTDITGEAGPRPGAGGQSVPVPGVPQAPDPVLQPGIVSEFTSGREGFLKGLFRPRWSLRVDSYHDDNVFLLPPGSEEGDFVWEIVPQVAFESSRPEARKRHYLRFGYDPQLIRFADFQSNDADNHRGSARYRFNGSELRAGFDQRTVQFSGTERELEDEFFDPGLDTEVGRRTEGTRHFTNAFAEMELDGDWELTLSATRFAREFDTPGLASSTETRGEVSLLHRLAPRTQAGLGTELGKCDTDGGSDTDFLQLLGIVRWEPTTKLAFELDGGIDARDVDGTERSDDLTTAIFEAGVEWTVSDATTFSIEAYRRADFSVNGDTIRRTGVRGSFRQGLLRRTHYTLRAGYEHSSFELFGEASPEDREDDYFYIRNSLDWKWSWGSVGVFHEFRHNDSNVRSEFERNQAGFGVLVEF
ncbi:MAG: hypothetical protein GWO24_22370, partial [Akkermansiaceae bacterium]|nr:hypothetical protein [Akkermansiaceae bacterium]